MRRIKVRVASKTIFEDLCSIWLLPLGSSIAWCFIDEIYRRVRDSEGEREFWRHQVQQDWGYKAVACTGLGGS